MSSTGTHIAERCSFVAGDVIDTRWRVEAFLGEGTFGQVFRVADNNGTRYALKLLKLWEVVASEREGLLKRFMREYETGRIQSPYLVHSICHGSVKGNAYIVMEYCNGGDLPKAIHNMPVNLNTVATHVLLGLKDLHAAGKVHRDLKPENVLMRDASHAVLTDFGISGDQNHRLTQRGWNGVPRQRFGTIAYMPPEQINPRRGNATVLPTTDIFSFGVMMYQLFTGQLPFGQLSSEADVPRYAANGKDGRWDRSPLDNIKDGQQWTRIIEGCLMPDFKTRLQCIDDILPLLPTGSGERHSSTPVNDFKHDISQGIVLRVMQGEDLGRVYQLNRLFSGNNSIINIGRDTPDVWNNLPLTENESAYISRRHCSIVHLPDERKWILRDGQYRVKCSSGLRSKLAYPCSTCSGACLSGTRTMEWSHSLNGTYVNSREVDANGIELKPGDIISIGETKMRVEGA